MVNADADIEYLQILDGKKEVNHFPHLFEGATMAIGSIGSVGY